MHSYPQTSEQNPGLVSQDGEKGRGVEQRGKKVSSGEGGSREVQEGTTIDLGYGSKLFGCEIRRIMKTENV